MRPRPVARSQPSRPGKIDKNKQRPNNKPKKSRPMKIDDSVLKKTVNTSVNGLDKIIKVLENGTEQVVDFLSNECSIIYECRVCLSLFRSLANFIAHKRVYCRKKFTDLPRVFDGQIEEKMVSITADFQKGVLESRSTSRTDIVNYLDALQSGGASNATKKDTSPDLFSVELDATKEALFHCFRHEGKHSSEDRSATVGPDTFIVGSPRLVNGLGGGDGQNSLPIDRIPSPINNVGSDTLAAVICPHCPKRFSSEKSLQSHCKNLHTLTTRTCFACPCCKKYLANTWSVYRHLSKVHKKSNEQIRKLRSQIQKKEITEDDSKIKSQNSPSVQNEMKSDQAAKVNDSEKASPGELHRCYICGKVFERRVTMLAHAQICRDKNSGLPCAPSSSTDGPKVSPTKEIMNKRPRMDSPSPSSLKKSGLEIINKRPRLDTPSPPPVTKSGIEIRMYYEKNKPITVNSTSMSSTPVTTPIPTAASPTSAATPISTTAVPTSTSVPNCNNGTLIDDTLHLKPTALALLASMPTARVILTKTPVPSTVSSIITTTPSPPPQENRPTTSREFSPKAEDIISRYRSRQNLSQIFERCDSLPVNNKVAVESVFCSDTDDSSSGCEFVLGARDIAQCIGTFDMLDDISNANDSFEFVNHYQNIGKEDKDPLALDPLLTDHDFHIKKEPVDLENELFESGSDIGDVEKDELVKQKLDSTEEDESNVQGGQNEVSSRVENGNEIELLPHDLENASDDDVTNEDSIAMEEDETNEDDDEEGSAGDEEVETDEEDDETGEEFGTSEGDAEISEEEVETSDAEEETEQVIIIDGSEDDEDEDADAEDADDDDDSPDDNRPITREDSLLKEEELNYLLKKTNHQTIPNGINSKYAINWVFRKINSYIDGPKKKCLLCYKTFHRVNLVRRHVATHLQLYNFKCLIDECNFKSFLRTDIVKHLIKVHKKKDVRRNRGVYMKRITNDMIPLGNDLPCMKNSSFVSSSESKVSSSRNSCDGGVSKNEIILRDRNGRPAHMDLKISSEVGVGNNVHDDDESNSFMSESDCHRDYQTSNMQLYDTDLDELLVNKDTESSNDKLKALMMQVIFGSNNLRCTNETVSDCRNGSTLLPSTSSPSTALESSSEG